MIIEIRGAEAGIAEYLRTGKKSGREHTREELDERVTLIGDLDVTEKIIDALNYTENYTHISFSFREDFVDVEKMERVVEMVQSFIFHAYRSEEYNVYAEAHLPKIKSYTTDSGEIVERKPHIHLVIPHRNLLTGKQLLPLGFVKHNIDFIDALQEHINASFGFESPKDHPVVDKTFNRESEMITRYKADNFTGRNKDLKAEIFEKIQSGKIRTYEELFGDLQRIGSVKIRNKGKGTEYLNLTMPGEKRGINLKEHVFTRKFLEMDRAGRRAFLQQEYKPEYYDMAEPKKTPEGYAQLLHEWADRRAAEVKYLNNQNALRKEYRTLETAKEQKTFLDAMKKEFYRRHRPPEFDGYGEIRSAKIESEKKQSYQSKLFSELYKIRSTVDLRGYYVKSYKNTGIRVVGNSKKDIKVIDRGSKISLDTKPTDLQTSVILMLDMAEGKGWDLLQLNITGSDTFKNEVARQVKERLQDRGEPIEQIIEEARKQESSPRVERDKVPKKVPDNYTAHKLLRGRRLAAVKRVDLKELKRELDPARVLEYIAKDRGALPEKYQVLFDKTKGEYRVKCGRRKLNVVDFMVKEMNYNFKDTSRILADQMINQRDDQRVLPLQHNKRRRTRH